MIVKMILRTKIKILQFFLSIENAKKIEESKVDLKKTWSMSSMESVFHTDYLFPEVSIISLFPHFKLFIRFSDSVENKTQEMQ
jgi:hypothetical protein